MRRSIDRAGNLRVCALLTVCGSFPFPANGHRCSPWVVGKPLDGLGRNLLRTCGKREKIEHHTHTAPNFQRVYNRNKLSRKLFIRELLFGIPSRLYCCRNTDISYLSWNSTPQVTIVILLPPALIID